MSARIEVVIGDITKIEVDAIVNAANETLLGGGGVDGAIHAAAGAELYFACKALNGCQTGDAKVTQSYGIKTCDMIVHTVGPIWDGGNYGEAEALASCYRRSIEEAIQHGARSIAFASISTGIYGYPKKEACKIACETVKAEIARFAGELERIVFVCFEDDTYALYRSVIG